MLIQMQFAQRLNSLCLPSLGSSDRTPLTLDSGKLIAIRWSVLPLPAEVSKIPTIPAGIRTTPYTTCSLLRIVSRATVSTNRLAIVALPAVVFGLNRELAIEMLRQLRVSLGRFNRSEPNSKGTYKWQIRRKQQLLPVPREASERDSSKHS